MDFRTDFIPRPALRLRSPRGFALILSLTVMAMLLLLCVGLAALLAMELRVAGASVSRSVASMNARASLRLALGQLQEFAGPDRRVTARMDILAKSAADVAAGDRWTGVWRTDRLVSEATKANPAPFVDRDTETASFKDRRTAAVYIPENENLGPLVSYSDALRPPRRGESLTEGVGAYRMVGAGSVAASALNRDGVLVPRLAITDIAGNPLGGVGWWTTDDNAKARTDLRDFHADGVDTDNSGGRIAPAIFGLGAIPGFASLERSKLPGDALQRSALTRSRLALSGVDPAAVKAKFHDLAEGSLSVLSDTERGGLKRDLTAFLISKTGAVPDALGIPGIDDNVPLADYEPEVAAKRKTAFYSMLSPRFGILRDWANVYQGSATVRLNNFVQTPDPRSGASAYHDGVNASLIDMTKLVKQQIQPVLVEASYFLRLTYDPSYTPGSPVKLRMQIYPRFQLWNPYNVALESRDYLVQMRMLSPLGSSGSTFKVLDGQGRAVNVTYNLPLWPGLGTTYGTLAFIVRAGSLPPGECAVYSGAGRATRYDVNNPSTNLLVPAAPNSANYFYIGDPPALPATVDMDPAGATYSLGDVREDDIACLIKEIPKGTTPGSLSTLVSIPMCMYANCSPQFGSGATAGAGLGTPGFRPVPLSPWTEDVIPDNSEYHSLRRRWISETRTNRAQYSPQTAVDLGVLGNHNVRSSINYRHPYDNNTAVGAPLFWASDWIRDYPDARTGWISPPARGGRTQGNPFAGIGEWGSTAKFPLFDLPSSPGKVGSLAYFRHARLSEYPWDPSYIVGESLMTTLAPSESTCRPAGQCYADWNALSLYARVATQGDVSGQQILFDRSYEFNRTLYDRFFLSTGDEAAKKAFLASPSKSPLPDMRLVPNPFSTGKDRAEALGSMQRAAGELMVAGGFNVNSTSVDAWRALFASLRGVPLGVAKPDAEGVTAYARVTRPAEGAASSSESERTPAANAGFRTLTDAEIGLLAQKMVEEVRLRGPFLSMADFVNRRLQKDFARPGSFTGDIPASYCGALEAAILRSGINKGTERSDTMLRAGAAYPTAKAPMMDQQAPYGTYGLPGNLTQGDFLQSLEPVLVARGDSFTVRVVGEGPDGATVRLEARIRRFPNPVRPSADNPMEPELKRGRDFGRRFRVVAIKELSPDEI